MNAQFYFREAQLHSGVPGTLIHISSIGCPDHLCSNYFSKLCLVSQKQEGVELPVENLYSFLECVSPGIESLSQRAVSKTQGQECKTSCSCSMIALNIQHEQLILAFSSVFKVATQTEPRSLHGNAALGLNSCSVIMFSSLLHLQVCQQGGHGPVLQTHNCELELPFVQVSWWCENFLSVKLII